MLKNRMHSLLKQNGYKYPKESLERKEIKESILNLELHLSVKMEITLLYQNLETVSNSLKEVKSEILIKGISDIR